MIIKKELANTESAGESDTVDISGYRQLLVQTLHQCSIKFPSVAPMVVPVVSLSSACMHTAHTSVTGNYVRMVCRLSFFTYVKVNVSLLCGLKGKNRVIHLLCCFYLCLLFVTFVYSYPSFVYYSPPIYVYCLSLMPTRIFYLLFSFLCLVFPFLCSLFPFLCLLVPFLYLLFPFLCLLFPFPY